MQSPPRSRDWTIDRIVPLLAGVLTLAGTALAAATSPWWLLLTTLVGANLLLYSAVGWCPATLLMARLGIPARAACAHPRT
ncbi:YgaP family membrane protein [Nocardia sp. NPDC001965]